MLSVTKHPRAYVDGSRARTARQVAASLIPAQPLT